MHIEITGPAVCIETNDDRTASVKIEGTMTAETEIETPNPNLDAYFYADRYFLEDFQYLEIEGREWELDLGAVDVYYTLTTDEVIESAKIRAAEDHTTVKEVLKDWKRLTYAPLEVEQALVEVDVEPVEEAAVAQ